MNMLQCQACHATIPGDAHFCGRCGKPTGVDQAETQQLSTGQVASPFFTDNDLPTQLAGWKWQRIETVPTAPLPREVALLSLFGDSINSSLANVPMVQGSPQIGGVPSLQGTLQWPGGAMTQAPLQQPPASAGGFSAPPNAPSSSAPMQPAPVASLHEQHHIEHHPHHTDVDHRHPSHHIHHSGHLHDSGTLHAPSEKRHRRHVRKQTKSLRHVGRWHLKSLFMSALSVCVLGGLAALILLPLLHGHAHPPATLILSGGVVPGGNVSVQGQNFTPGGTVSFTIDGHLVSRVEGSSTARVQGLPGASDLADVLQLVQDTTKTRADGTSITVKSDGSFETTIQVDPRWLVGSSHVLVATERSSGQKASLTLVIPHPASLASCSSRAGTTSIVLGPVPEGQAPPASAMIVLCTTGVGLVQWSASWNRQQVKWLQIAQSGSIQAPLAKELTISASAKGLKSGSYNAIVTFTDQHHSTPVTLNVTFIVRSVQATSCLSTGTQSLNYDATQGQADPGSQLLALTNCGLSGSWSATTHTDDGADWLHVNPTSGQLNSKATSIVTVSVSSSSVAQGIYSGQITFKMGTGIAVVNVLLNVQPSSKNPPCISVTPQSLTLSATPGNTASQTVSVGNCGLAGSWSATSSTSNGANWLSVAPGSGNLASNASQNVSITAASAQLPAGTYSGKVTLTMGSSSQTVNVSFTVVQQQQNACLSVNPPSLPFTATQGQSDPTPQTVTLTNCGPAGSWSAATASGSRWLTLSQSSNTLGAGAQQNVNVSPLISGLSAGTYTDSITFTMQSGSATATQTVSVSLTIQPPPPPPTCIHADPGSLQFTGAQGGSDPAPQTVALTNCGPDGSWLESTANNSGWLAISPASSSLNAGAQQNVTVSASIAGLSAGTYTDTITFTITTSSGTQQATVAITLTVQPPSACLQINSGPLTFTGTQGGSNPAGQTITVTNCGPTGSFSESNSSSWLSVDTNVPTLNAGATQSVDVSALIAGLNAETYTDTMTFTIVTSTGTQQQQTLAVTLIVQPPPCLQINSITPAPTGGIVYISQTTPHPPVTVVVANCGNASGALSASTNVNWLPDDLQPNTNLDAGGMQTITISPSASTPFNVVGTVTITLTSNGVATQVTVQIEMYVGCC